MMTGTANDFLDILRSWVGLNEIDGSFMKILHIYNSVKPLPRDYPMQDYDEWCAATIAAAAIESNTVDVIGRECSCSKYIEIFKNADIWIEDGNITPIPGYLILYSWSKNVQPNDNAPNHIGAVESVYDNTITVIEGNKGEAIGRRTIPIGWGKIRGYACPKYSGHISITKAVARTIVQKATGFDDNTIKYIADMYKYGDEAIIRLAKLLI